MNLENLTIGEAASAIRGGKVSALDYAQALLSRIDNVESRVHAWFTVDREAVLSEARKCEAEARAGRLRGPLHGIPIGVKDIFYTIGNAGAQIFAFDTNTFRELFRLNIGETVTGNTTQFGTGTLVASQDGKYLAVETSSGIRLLTLPASIPSPTPSPTPTFSSARAMVFDHADKYLYITT